MEPKNALTMEIDVLIVEPNKAPYIATIQNRLENMQTVVDGLIEMVDLDENTCLVCNVEGKLNGLHGNRKIGNDIIAGTFFLCGMNKYGNPISLTDKQIDYYSDRFAQPEQYTDKQMQDALSYEIKHFKNSEEFLDLLSGNHKDEEDEEDIEL